MEKAKEIIKRLFRWIRHKEPCQHQNARIVKFLDPDGTPCATTSCPECGWYDSGPVIADPKTWLKS